MLWEHERFLIIYWQVNYNTGFRCVVECNFVPTLVDLVYSSFPMVYKLRRNFILTNKFSPRIYTKIFEAITRKQTKPGILRFSIYLYFSCNFNKSHSRTICIYICTRVITMKIVLQLTYKTYDNNTIFCDE